MPVSIEICPVAIACWAAAAAIGTAAGWYVRLRLFPQYTQGQLFERYCEVLRERDEANGLVEEAWDHAHRLVTDHAYYEEHRQRAERWAETDRKTFNTLA